MKEKCNLAMALTWTGIFEVELTLNKRLTTIVADGAALIVFCNAVIMLNMVGKSEVFIHDRSV